VNDILNELFSEALLDRIYVIEEQRERQRRARSLPDDAVDTDEDGNSIPVPRRPYDPMTPIRMRDVIIRGEEGRERRAAWVEYIQHARDVGLLTDDLRNRLTDPKKLENVRGALGECLAAYSIARDFGFQIVPGQPGRKAKNLEFNARKGESALHIEVKSPAVYFESPRTAGDGTKAIRTAAENANNQFEEGRANVLVLAPLFQTPIWRSDDCMRRALIGQYARRIWLRDDDGTMLPLDATAFLFDGRMTKTHWNDGEPGVQLTRISAVISVEEVLDPARGQIIRKHVIAHNPAAAVKVDLNLFRPHRQLVCVNERIRWVPPYPEEW
jgi:hypothetical protein